MSDASGGGAWPATTEEVLAWPGDGRARRYQLIDGEVRTMSPGSAIHGLIQATLTSLIEQRLAGDWSPCMVVTQPAVSPRLRADMNVRVPDIGVTCTPVAAGQIVIEDPVLLIEILSPSNTAQTWMNVRAHTTIPSVQEILVVHSTRMEIQILRPSAKRIWPDRPETIVAGGRLKIESIGLDCAIERIYARTPFA